MTDVLYSVRIEGPFQGQRRRHLLDITGSRETVIEAALKVILDCGQDWQEQSTWGSPPFEVSVTKIT